MCYSAKCRAAYKSFCREYGVVMDMREFVTLIGERPTLRTRVPRVLEAMFDDPEAADEQTIKAMIDQHNADLVTRNEQELFAQKTRLVEAERKLAIKATKAATESQRIATDNIAKAIRNLAELRRTDNDWAFRV